MRVQVRGIDNSRPVLITYELSDQPVAEAVSTKIPGRFTVSSELKSLEHYALLDQQQKFVGMVIRRYAPRAKSHQATLMSFMKGPWVPKIPYAVHSIEEVDNRLDY